MHVTFHFYMTQCYPFVVGSIFIKAKIFPTENHTEAKIAPDPCSGSSANCVSPLLRGRLRSWAVRKWRPGAAAAAKWAVFPTAATATSTADSQAASDSTGAGSASYLLHLEL